MSVAVTSWPAASRASAVARPTLPRAPVTRMRMARNLTALRRWCFQRAAGLWRAGPVAGHGLRLRKLRLRGVSRATRPNTVFASPGSAVRAAVRGRYSFAAAAPAPGTCARALRRSVAAAVVCLRVGEPTGAPVFSHSTTRLDGASCGWRRECRFHAGAGAREQLRGTVALPPKQARAYGASRRSLLVHSGRLALDWPDARNHAEGGGHYERIRNEWRDADSNRGHHDS